jgi:hypothetical protein
VTSERLSELRALAYRATSGKRTLDFTGQVRVDGTAIVWGCDDDVSWGKDADGELFAALDVETVLELLSLAESALPTPERPPSLPRVEPG